MTVPDDFWICSACTWVNKSTESSCKACGKNAPPGAVATTAPSPAVAPVYTYQPPVTASSPPTAYAYPTPVSATAPPAVYAYQSSVSAASAAPDVPAELWVCSKCEWVNKNTTSSCKACGSNAPPGTVVVAAPTPVAPPTPVVASTPIAAPTPPSTSSQGYGYTYTPMQVPVVAPPRPAVQPTSPQAYSAPSSTSHNAVRPPKQPAQVQGQTDDFVTGFANHGKTKHSSAPPTARSATHSYAATPAAVPTAPLKQVFKIKEKFYGFGDNFTIKDGSDRSVYKVKGKVFSWGDKLSFQDMSGKELAFISQEMFSFQPQYEIHRNGAVFAKVVKEWTWMSKRFTLDVPGPNDYTIDGSFWEHDFTFMRKGRPVARVNKRYFSYTDSYGVEIDAGEDVVSILCACIVIDQVLHDD